MLTQTTSSRLIISVVTAMMWYTLIVTVKVARFSLKGPQTLIPVSLRTLKLCLQRSYALRSTTEHMRCHHQYPFEDNVLCHWSAGAIWKHFGKKDLNCAVEHWNVRLGLCADGFNPYVLYSRSYSIWSMVVTAYNLSPEMFMTTPFMFLTCVILDPKNPKNRMDICLSLTRYLNPDPNDPNDPNSYNRHPK